MLSCGISWILGATLSLAAPSADTLRVDRWIVAGPLPSGSRESLADPIAPLEASSLSPVEGDSLPSWMAPDGWVRWVAVEGEGDAVALAYEGIDWDGLSDSWGAAGVVCSGLAYGEVEVAAAGAYLIEAPGVGSLYIDGRRYLGNPYTTGAPFAAPIRLEEGKHRVLLRVGGMGPRSVRFRLVARGEPLDILEDDLTLPDRVENQPIDSWGAAPILNLTGERVTGAVLRFDGEQIEEAVVEIPPLEPEAILKVPFPVRGSAPAGPPGKSGASIRVEWRGVSIEAVCSLRVRGPREHRLETFISKIDGSVQHYGIRPPSGDDPGPHALILTLHGASVGADGQAAAYQPKEWAYVVAPTNTRPFGFDWQDWGRLNAIETLDLVLARYSIDPNRVVLAGHSMGGHGVWHVGLAHADRFAALAPSAGWANMATYVPFSLRRDLLLGDPRLRGIYDRAIAPDNPLAFMRNARGLPVFVLHGALDDNVPVLQGRMLAQAARDEGVRVVYREVPGMNHWWDDPATPGTDCIDLAEMMEFLREARREPRPQEVCLRTADLGACDRMHWLRVLAAEHPFDFIEADGAARDGRIEISTRGVRALAVDPTGLLEPGKIDVRIDRTPIESRWLQGEIAFVKGTDGEWKAAKGIVDRMRRGPIKAAFFEPFIYVYGTRGSAEETAAARRLAVLDAQAWYLRADGNGLVLPDTAVTAEIIQSRNLILYATPGSNDVLRRIERDLPIRATSEGIGVAERFIAGANLAARFVYENPAAPARLVEVVEGTDIRGLELAAGSNPCHSSSGYPDFVVYDAAVRRLGWGGVIAGGWYTMDGQIPADGRDAVIR